MNSQLLRGQSQDKQEIKKKYNINKYKEEKRTTAQVEPEEAIQKLAEEQPRNIYHSRPNLEDMKFIIDKIWATVAIRKRGDDFIFSSDNFIRLWALITQNAEDDIEIVLEEPLMRFHSCMGKTYKKKDLIHVTDVLIKNVSVSVIDNVGIYIDRDYTLLKFNGQTVGITTAKSGVLHTGDYVVGITKIMGNRRQSNLYMVRICSASYGAGITCRQSMAKSKLWNRTGKIQVGYWGIAKVIDIALIVSPLALPSILTILKLNLPQLQTSPAVAAFNKQIISAVTIGGGSALPVAQRFISLNGMSINTPQCRFPATMLSSGETQTDPQAVKNPSQNVELQLDYTLIMPLSLIDQKVQGLEGQFTELKLTTTYIASEFASIFIVQFTQQVQTIEQVADPLAASGARDTNSNGFFLENINFWFEDTWGVKHAAQWIDPTLHKVLSTVAHPVGMIHRAIGGALGSGASLAGAVDRLQELARQQHFRGYYLLNTDITSLPDSADGDFVISAESGTVWMYSNDLNNSGDIVPDQETPANDATPLVDSTTGAAGVSNEQSRGDHQHPLQISSVLPQPDTVEREAGTPATYTRSDHTHHENLSNDTPIKHSGSGTAGTSNIYASAQHQHPFNTDPTVANVPLVNITAAANGTSDYYCRNDHVHPQQLTFTGLLTSTMFIKNGAQATDVLQANGDSKPISDIAGDRFVKISGQFGQSITGKLNQSDSTESFDDLDINQYTTKYTIQGAFVKKRGKSLQEIQGVLRHSGDDEESEDGEDY
ncbi:MAG: hypothetical protein EZS28_007662 [Streblomastix strix]|uniref:Uncharacterized protein n=1 Tax=Streblomastix strix TaxID=222440 RepID=A0A5J4WPA3_9EUKA|nr:MAG: hypothetical protein EZS28_007662 [Streblomastix strix]